MIDLGITGFFRSIFLKIANKLGLKLTYKPDTGNDYGVIHGISWTATISNRISTLTNMDLTMTVTGESSKARYLNSIVNNEILDIVHIAASAALGTGECLIKPWTDGVRIGFDLIDNSNFCIYESVGSFIKCIGIRCDEIKTNSGNTYERFEVQQIGQTKDDNGEIIPCVYIYQYAFKNGSEVPLSTVKAWESFEPVTVIPKADRLLFGRIRCPVVNRENLNSPTSVPLTYGLEGVINYANKAYEAFNTEIERSEAFVWLDKTLFTKDEKGNAVIPRGRERQYELLPRVTNENGDNTLIQEHAPSMRDSNFENGIKVNLHMLELLCGFDRGVLTEAISSHATATELKASLQLTFAFITCFQRGITRALNDLLYAVDIITNAMMLPIFGDYRLDVDWSSSYVEDISEQYERLLKAYNIGAVSAAEVRAFIKNEDLTTAQAAVEALQREKNSEDKSADGQ